MYVQYVHLYLASALLALRSQRVLYFTYKYLALIAMLLHTYIRGAL